MSCDELIILTDVPHVYRDFGTENQTPLSSLTASQAKELAAQGQFEAGTMLPKIEAAVNYLDSVKSGRVLITSLEKVRDAVKGKSGTIIIEG